LIFFRELNREEAILNLTVQAELLARKDQNALTLLVGTDLPHELLPDRLVKNSAAGPARLTRSSTPAAPG
jgi:hypothetical protein